MINKNVLSLSDAQLLLDAAQKKSEEFGGMHVICIADDAGYPIALRRLDKGKVTSVQIAENKAFTAAAHRRITHTFTNTFPGEEAWGIFTQHGGRITVFVADTRFTSMAKSSAALASPGETASRTSRSVRPPSRRSRHS